MKSLITTLINSKIVLSVIFSLSMAGFIESLVYKIYLLTAICAIIISVISFKTLN